MTDTLNATEAAAFLLSTAPCVRAMAAVVEKHYGHLSESHIKQYANNAKAK